MKEISNPWLSLSEYNCFGCCPTNSTGCQMRFYEDGDDIVSVWKPTQNHQSWLNTLHGGVQAALLDEICGWVVFRKLNTAGVTARMEMRYRKAISTKSPYVVLRAHLKDIQRNIATVEGEIQDADGKLCIQCMCTYFTYPTEKAKAEMYFISPELVGDELTLEEVIARVDQPRYKKITL